MSALNEGSPVFSANGLLAGVAVVTGAVEKGRSVTIAAPAGSFSDAVGAWREVRHGYGHAESGKHKEALAASRRAVRLRPDYAEAQYALGVALSSMELYGEAQDAYAAAVKLMPHHLSARLYLGKTYTLLGKHGEAVETYLQLLALAPDYVEAYVLLGYSYQEKEMNHSAIHAYEEAIRIAPDFVYAYLMLGGTFFIRYLVGEGGFTIAAAGFLWLLVGVVSVVSGFLWGGISDRWGRRSALVGVFLVQGTAFLIFGLTASGRCWSSRPGCSPSPPGAFRR